MDENVVSLKNLIFGGRLEAGGKDFSFSRREMFS